MPLWWYLFYACGFDGVAVDGCIAEFVDCAVRVGGVVAVVVAGAADEVVGKHLACVVGVVVACCGLLR